MHAYRKEVTHREGLCQCITSTMDSRPTTGICRLVAEVVWDNSSISGTVESPTELPLEFYDRSTNKNIDRVVSEEEYPDIKEDAEYRTVIIGPRRIVQLVAPSP